MSGFLASLRFRLIILVLLALVPALGVIVYTGAEQRGRDAIQAEEEALRLARAAASSQEQLVKSGHQLLHVLTQMPAVQNQDPAACGAFLADLIRDYVAYAGLFVADREGVITCRSNPDFGPLQFTGHYVLQHVLDTREPAIGEYRIDPPSGRGFIALGYPILDARGQVQAEVFASLEVSSLNQLARQSLLPPGSTLTAYDRMGTIVVRYPDSQTWVGKATPAAPLFAIIQSHRGEGTVEAVGEDSVPRLYAYTPVHAGSESELYIAVGIPTAIAFAGVNQALERNLITLGLIGLLALAAAWFGGDVFFLRQVNALLETTGRLAQGDLSTRTVPQRGIGELSQLARAFDRMVQALEQRDHLRRQAENEVRRWSERLEGLIGIVAEAIGRPLEVRHLVEMALGKTLGVMELAAGCIWLKRGEGLERVAQQGLPASGAPMVPGSQAVIEPSDLTAPLLSDRVQDLTDSVLLDALGLEGSRTWTSVPISSKGRVLGIMCLAAGAQPLGAHEKSVLAAVGRQIAVAIENADLYEQVQSIAALKERERLSRELHDGLAQVLGALSLRAEYAKELVNAGRQTEAAAELQEIQGTVFEAHRDLRESILGLRATASTDGGLVSTLKEYAFKFGVQTGIRVVLGVNGNGRMAYSPGAEVQLLRIIQEALTNVRKHSGAKQAFVQFEMQPGGMVVTIKDDGQGFDPARIQQADHAHLGLQSMRERAESVHGRFEIRSRLGAGTEITVTIPAHGGGG